MIDAAGMLTVSQRLMPLATGISLFGTAEPNDISRVDLGPLRVGGAAAPVREVTDAFAPSAFAKLSDADKLRAAAFEQRAAGVQATSGDALITDAVVSWPVQYETIELDSAVSTTPRRGTGSPDQGDFEALARGGLIGLSAASAARARIAQRGSVLDVAAGEERFAVAGIGDLRPLDASGAVVGAAAQGALLSYSDATARRDALVASGAAADLQILPEAQVG